MTEGGSNWDAMAQVAEMTKQNRLLQEQLQSKERELIHMRELIEAQKDLGSQDVQAAKIGELAKKLKDMNMQQAKDRSTIEKLKKDLEAARKEAGPAPKNFRPGEAVADDPVESLRRELKSLKEHNNSALERVGKLEAQNRVLQQERDRLVLALKAEVGEDTSIEQILKDMAAGTSTWVGRMQQVAILKDKVKELQKAQGTVQDSKVERDNLERIRKLRADKMQKEENTAVELEKARAEVQQLKVKFDSVTSRVKIMTDDNKDLRGKLQVVLDKTLNDDRLITALKSQLDLAKRQLKDQGKSQETDRYVLEELDALRMRSQQQETQIDRQQGIIASLQQKLQSAATSAAPSGTVQRVTGRGLVAAPSTSAGGSRPGSSALGAPAVYGSSRPGSSRSAQIQIPSAEVPSIDGRPSSVKTLPPIDPLPAAGAQYEDDEEEGRYESEAAGMRDGGNVDVDGELEAEERDREDDGAGEEYEDFDGHDREEAYKEEEQCT